VLPPALVPVPTSRPIEPCRPRPLLSIMVRAPRFSFIDHDATGVTDDASTGPAAATAASTRTETNPVRRPRRVLSAMRGP
jgi:hypothetical protein